MTANHRHDRHSHGHTHGGADNERRVFWAMLLILRTGWFIVTDSAHILLQGTPRAIDIGKLRTDLRDTLPEVQDVHHVHAWSLTEARLIMTLHVVVDRKTDRDTVLQQVGAYLEKQWQVGHATIQIEQAGCSGKAGAGKHQRNPGIL